VARQDNGGEITRAQQTSKHIWTQSSPRARNVKTQPESKTTDSSGHYEIAKTLDG